MKKMVLIAALGLLTTAGVTAAVLSNKKSEKKAKKECVYKKDATAKKKNCTRSKIACY